MEYNEISKEVKAAADAFLEGTASAEQERQLIAFFEETDGVGLSPEMRALKTMISGAGELSAVTFNTEEVVENCRSARRSGGNAYWWAGAVAAAAAIVVSVFIFAPQSQQVYGYDINGREIKNVDQALDHLGSLNLLSELESSMDEAENILNQLVGE